MSGSAGRGPVPAKLRMFVVSHKARGKSLRWIAKALHERHGLKVSHETVRNWLQPRERCPKCGRKAKAS